jgi:hypothetical protein
MNTDKLIALVQNPVLLKDVELNELEKLVKVYPYFSIARVLLTKKMQQTQHLLLKKEIKKTAVSVPNRKLLYEFLYHTGLLKNIEKSEEITTKIEDTNAETLTPEIILDTEETTSSFSKPVEIESTVQPSSSFAKPINLKDFGKEKASDIDILEQQIIGQTIEHVLSLEIESQNEILPIKEDSTPTPEQNSQKFSDWLNILDHDRLKTWRENPEENEEPVTNEADIINSFLQKDINIITPSNNEIEYSPSNLARLSLVDDEDFVTETLANIYAEQGNLQKALTAYKKLLLKYPEKKTYFAARIEKIEKDLK